LVPLQEKTALVPFQEKRNVPALIPVLVKGSVPVLVLLKNNPGPVLLPGNRVGLVWVPFQEKGSMVPF
jgi:hypothetical protein